MNKKKLTINWPKIGAAATATLTGLAALPYETGMQEIGNLVGEPARRWVIGIGLIATLLLRIKAGLGSIMVEVDLEKELQKEL